MSVIKEIFMRCGIKYTKLLNTKVMEIKTQLKSNAASIKRKLSSPDIIHMSYALGDGTKCLLVYIASLVNKDVIGEQLLKPLSEFNEKPLFAKVNKALICPEKKTLTDTDEAVTEVLSGNTVLFVDGWKKALSVSAKRFDKRAVTEPPTSTVIKGPREGFTENIETNMSLLRRRIKSEKLKIENLNIGKYSNTVIAVCYLEGVVKDGLKEKVLEKLNAILIDSVSDSSYIADFISDHPNSLFKQVGNTEKPDIFVSRLMEGRIGIIVDGSPIALTLPYIMLEDLQSPEDYYVKQYKATFSRLIRVFSVFLAVLVPALYVSAQLFHLQLIPLSFLLTIVNSIKGLPLSPSFEMFFTLMIFEVLNEASVRMPKYVGMVVSIVGGLVLGETAVNAGIISAPALMIIALSGICLYTVPELEKPFSIVRLILLLIAGVIGLYGIIISVAGLLIYLVSFENYDTPLLAPFAPLITHDLKDSVIKYNLLSNKKRPSVFKSPNKTRIKDKLSDDK